MVTYVLRYEVSDPNAGRADCESERYLYDGGHGGPLRRGEQGEQLREHPVPPYVLHRPNERQAIRIRPPVVLPLTGG